MVSTGTSGRVVRGPWQRKRGLFLVPDGGVPDTHKITIGAHQEALLLNYIKETAGTLLGCWPFQVPGFEAVVGYVETVKDQGMRWCDTPFPKVLADRGLSGRLLMDNGGEQACLVVRMDYLDGSKYPSIETINTDSGERHHRWQIKDYVKELLTALLMDLKAHKTALVKLSLVCCDNVSTDTYFHNQSRLRPLSGRPPSPPAALRAPADDAAAGGQPAIDDDQGWTSKMVGLMSRPGNLRETVEMTVYQQVDGSNVGGRNSATERPPMALYVPPSAVARAPADAKDIDLHTRDFNAAKRSAKLLALKFPGEELKKRVAAMTDEELRGQLAQGLEKQREKVPLKAHIEALEAEIKAMKERLNVESRLQAEVAGLKAKKASLKDTEEVAAASKAERHRAATSPTAPPPASSTPAAAPAATSGLAEPPHTPPGNPLPSLSAPPPVYLPFQPGMAAGHRPGARQRRGHAGRLDGGVAVEWGAGGSSQSLVIERRFGHFLAAHRALLPPCEPQQVMPLPPQPAIDDDQGWTSKMVGLMSRPGNLRETVEMTVYQQVDGSNVGGRNSATEGQRRWLDTPFVRPYYDGAKRGVLTVGDSKKVKYVMAMEYLGDDWTIIMDFQWECNIPALREELEGGPADAKPRRRRDAANFVVGGLRKLLAGHILSIWARMRALKLGLAGTDHVGSDYLIHRDTVDRMTRPMFDADPLDPLLPGIPSVAKFIDIANTIRVDDAVDDADALSQPQRPPDFCRDKKRPVAYLPFDTQEQKRIGQPVGGKVLAEAPESALTMEVADARARQGQQLGESRRRLYCVMDSYLEECRRRGWAMGDHKGIIVDGEVMCVFGEGMALLESMIKDPLVDRTLAEIFVLEQGRPRKAKGSSEVWKLEGASSSRMLFLETIVKYVESVLSRAEGLAAVAGGPRHSGGDGRFPPGRPVCPRPAERLSARLDADEWGWRRDVRAAVQRPFRKDEGARDLSHTGWWRGAAPDTSTCSFLFPLVKTAPYPNSSGA
ncbi:unnamed protein product [Vitrella brassicaformis CCMP3155]|uniref:Uncharacterized protein n=1 Tax=Vitrella brassicaformis (strain CCMP3155) TaxID=1169540 RepID=A0A0G4FEW9_VITBC|nr:unnamed protein product [Vitrella brassicaformis CCMP3155]|eukprot:CEM11732.1 unnamed protein product [Vitrella brassicaformis CCMP3155]